MFCFSVIFLKSLCGKLHSMSPPCSFWQLQSTVIPVFWPLTSGTSSFVQTCPGLRSEPWRCFISFICFITAGSFVMVSLRLTSFLLRLNVLQFPLSLIVYWLNSACIIFMCVASCTKIFVHTKDPLCALKILCQCFKEVWWLVVWRQALHFK